MLAGLVPALKNDAIPGSQHWHYAILKPGARPLDALAAALAQLQGGDLGSMIRISHDLAADNRALLLAAELLRTGRPGMQLLLIIDQFEELWTAIPAEEAARVQFLTRQQAPFLWQLLTALAAPDTPLRIVITIRADFLPQVTEHPELAEWVGEHTVLVSPMTPDELRDAIIRPVETLGGHFESGLVDELITQVHGRVAGLPLLEYTLLELWQQRTDERALTWASYRALGGVEGALADRAERILAEYTGPGQWERIHQLLLRLIQPGEGVVDTRRRVRLADLVPAGGTLVEVQTLLAPLIAARLLTAGYDEIDGAATIEVAHEVLIQAWPTLRKWIHEARADLRFQLQLEAAAQEWQSSDQHTDLLWSGLRLANARDWVARASLLNARDQAFFDASCAQEQRDIAKQTAAEHERRKQRRRLIFLSSLLVVALIFISVITLFLRSMSEANARAQALGWAGEALVSLQESSIRSLPLSLAAQSVPPRATDAPLIYSALLRVTDFERKRHILSGYGNNMVAAAWSPDNRTILTGGDDGVVRLWDTANAQVLHTLQGHTDAITTARWSPDGSRVLTASKDGTARLWDATNGQVLHTLSGHTDAITTARWSPDGSRVLTASKDGTVRLWDATKGQVLHMLTVDADAITTALWSPDGRMVLTGTDNTAHLWDAAGGQVLHILNERSNITVAAWSPDSKKLLTGDGEGNVRLWDATGGWALQALNGHTHSVNVAMWSPDGQTILTSGWDATVRLWDAATGQQRYLLSGHTDTVTTAAWSPNGRMVLTGAWDGTARLWDVASGQALHTFRGHTDAVTAVVWSPDGRKILTGSADGTAQTWLIDERLLIAELTRHVCTVYEYDDTAIEAAVPGWNWVGCNTALTAVTPDLREYDRLRGR